MSSSSPHVEDRIPEPESSRSRVPIWLPVSAFIGTSVAIAIPLLMVRRQRKSLTQVARVGLHDSRLSTTSPPPRRRQTGVTSTTVSDLRARLVARATTPTTFSFKSESSSDSTSPGITSLMSAMSHLTLSNGMWAGKAFIIATGLVTVGGGIFILGVKTMLGIENVNEFGTKMRAFLWSAWPSLASRIHRAPESEEERQAALQLAPFGVQEEWNVEESQNRLRRAYDEGGFSLWAYTALRELEAEARVERAKRQREVDQAAQFKS